MNDAATEPASSTDAVDALERELAGTDYETPADKVQACVAALRDTYPHEQYPWLDPKHDYDDQHGVWIAVHDHGRRIVFQHTFKTVVPDTVAAIVAETGCEVVHSMVSYQEALGTTETMLFVVPSEYAAEIDPEVVDENHAGWYDGDHLDSGVDVDVDEQRTALVSEGKFLAPVLGGYAFVLASASSPPANGIVALTIDLLSLGLFCAIAMIALAWQARLSYLARARVFE